jgi:hypothetical protein
VNLQGSGKNLTAADIFGIICMFLFLILVFAVLLGCCDNKKDQQEDGEAEYIQMVDKARGSLVAVPPPSLQTHYQEPLRNLESGVYTPPMSVSFCFVAAEIVKMCPSFLPLRHLLLFFLFYLLLTAFILLFFLCY